jgi:hypothetical protein
MRLLTSVPRSFAVDVAELGVQEVSSSTGKMGWLAMPLVALRKARGLLCYTLKLI